MSVKRHNVTEETQCYLRDKILLKRHSVTEETQCYLRDSVT
mgnify:CR=1 FL=1